MSDRALSSALDLSLCLLLISAAMLIVTTVPESTQNPVTSPSATLAVFGSVTATGVEEHASTPLERLTAGAIARARGTPSRADRLEASVEKLLNRTTGNRQVIVRWQPVPELGVGGQVVVGAEPPPTAAVDTVRTVIPIESSTVAGSLNEAARQGFTTLANVTAQRIVARLSPPCRTVADVRGARCPPSRRHDNSVATLSADIETLLRDRYADPEQARASLSLSTVTVVVRTWST
jgi:hypothetical protein